MLFETERLYFRLLDENDVKDIQQIWGDPEVMIHCGGTGNTSSERFRKTIDFYRTLFHKDGYTVYGVIEKESNNLIGAAGFNPTDIDVEIELIYHFKKNVWGNGYGAEAASACLQTLNPSTHIQGIIASVDKSNDSSKRILEKIGFTYQGLKWFEDTGQDEHCFYYPLSS